MTGQAIGFFAIAAAWAAVIAWYWRHGHGGAWRVLVLLFGGTGGVLLPIVAGVIVLTM